MTLDTVAARELPAQTEVALARSAVLFRNQFVLGPRCPDQLIEWPGVAVAGDFWLATHPELSVTRVVGHGRALTLVGFIFDPNDPLADDRSILSRLLDGCDSIARITKATADLGGRWLLIVECAGAAYLLTDALGLRQALCTRPEETGALWVVSQAGLAAELLGLEVDERAADFLDCYAVRALGPEYYWPGTSTPLKGLRRLLPNHALDLRTGAVRRYWPKEAPPALRPEFAVERIGNLMTGLLCAAAARFELAVSVTAGVDSRLVLAAARPIQHQVTYVTVRQCRMSDSSADLHVPARLLRRLGLSHEVIRAPGSMSADFSWTFKRNVFLAHDHYGPDAEAIAAHFDRRKVAVTGSGAEVGRCAARQELPLARWGGVSARQLAWMERMEHPYVIDCFQEWLRDAGEAGHVDLRDLFEWEQGQGSWLAATQLEFDSAWRDIFTPYNCRALLVTMLGVSERYRSAPDYVLFTSTAKRLWPEALDEPINPHKQQRALIRWRRLLARAVRSHLATR